MFKKEELDMKLLSELQPIAEQFGIRNISKFNKEKLVYEIIKQQSERPGPEVADDAAPAEEAPKRNLRRTKATAIPDVTPPTQPTDSTTAGPDAHRTRQRVRRETVPVPAMESPAAVAEEPVTPPVENQPVKA